MKFVPDTHALLWYLQDHPRCSTAARQLFATAGTGELIVSVIVLAELLFVSRKQQWNSDFSMLLDRLQSDARIVIVPFTAELLQTVVQCPALEMHDAVIVATAQRYQCAVMTCDRVIIASGLVSVLPV